MYDMLMYMTIMILIGLALLGAILGSFCAAQVWRLRAMQLQEDKAVGEEYDAAELRRLQPLLKNKVKNDRSRCLSCKHQLAWYDLLPVFSWLSLKGACRYCKEKIGTMEFFAEVGLAATFATSYLLWPYEITTLAAGSLFAIWLVVLTLLAILFMYDAKWFLLPDRIVFPLVLVSLLYFLIKITWLGEPFALVDFLIAVAIMPGIYLVLYYVSGGRWIGFGDVKLGVALVLLMASWSVTALGFFLANFIGVLYIVPLMMAKKITRKTHIPFGPFLIIGMCIAVLVGPALIDWYIEASMSLLLLS